MHEVLLAALRLRRSEMRQQWEALLRAEPVTSALGHPDSLVHMIDWTLDEIFAALTNPPIRHRAGGTRFTAHPSPHCPCGRNPLLNYFLSGEQTMREALILVQASLAALDPLERDASFEELNGVLHQISRREIAAFCGLCQLREDAPRERRSGATACASHP